MKKMSPRKKAVIFFSLLALWLIVVFNGLVVNRYAYAPTASIAFLAKLSAFLVAIATTWWWFKGICKIKKDKFFSYLLLILLPIGMAFVGFGTVKAAGSTLHQLVGLIKENEIMIVKVSDKTDKGYAPSGGCRYTMDFFIEGENVAINNHCVDVETYYALLPGENYKSSITTTAFGLMIFEVGGMDVSMIPNLSRY